MTQTQASKTYKKSSTKCLLHTKGGGSFFISYTELHDGSIRLSDAHHTVNSWTDQNGNINPLFYLLTKHLLPDNIDLMSDGEIVATINNQKLFDKTASDIAVNVFMITFDGHEVKH